MGTRTDEQATLDHKVADIAAELHLVVADTEYQGVGWDLGEMGEGLHIRYWSHKFEVSGWMPRDREEASHIYEHSPHIKVSPTRTSLAIAKDIRRRLMPGYLLASNKAKARIQEYLGKVADRDYLGDQLYEILEGNSVTAGKALPRISGTRIVSRYGTEESDSEYVSFELTPGGSTVNVKLQLSNAEAIDLARYLTGKSIK